MIAAWATPQRCWVLAPRRAAVGAPPPSGLPRRLWCSEALNPNNMLILSERLNLVFR